MTSVSEAAAALRLELEGRLELAESDAEREEIRAQLDAVAPAVPEVVESTATEVVVRPDVEQDVYLAMDAMDEAQIMDALQGRPSEVMVYSFPKKGGGTQHGLSWAGVAECVRTMNVEGHTRIRVSPNHAPIIEEYQEDDSTGTIITYHRVLVYAEDEKNGGGNWGLASQAKFQTFKDKGRKPELDHFGLTKCLSKAQRNAMHPLIPVEYRELVIAQALKDEARVRQIRAGGTGATPDLPPPLRDEKALAQVETARKLFRELQEVNRLAMYPAVFNQYLTRAESSHQRLDDLIAHLEGELEKQKGGAA